MLVGKRSHVWLVSLLDPIERTSETLCGLIIVLTFTGSLNVATAGQRGARAMLHGALGCIIAWGTVDATLYVMGRMAEERKGRVLLRSVQETADPAEGRRLIADALPSVIASTLQPRELDAMQARLRELPARSVHPRPRKEDFFGAIGVFLLMLVSILPVGLPFLLMRDEALARHVSNAIAILLLFVTGYRYGRKSGGRPWGLGISMVLLGVALVGATMALGG